MPHSFLWHCAFSQLIHGTGGAVVAAAKGEPMAVEGGGGGGVA